MTERVKIPAGGGEVKLTDEAKIMALQLMARPDIKELLSQTKMHSTLECWGHAGIITTEAAHDPRMLSGRVKATSVFREALLLLKRSLASSAAGGSVLDKTATLALEQVAVEQEQRGDFSDGGL